MKNILSCILILTGILTSTAQADETLTCDNHTYVSVTTQIVTYTAAPLYTNFTISSQNGWFVWGEQATLADLTGRASDKDFDLTDLRFEFFKGECPVSDFQEKTYHCAQSKMLVRATANGVVSTPGDIETEHITKNVDLVADVDLTLTLEKVNGKKGINLSGKINNLNLGHGQNLKVSGLCSQKHE